jgi:hypothetical protein
MKHISQFWKLGLDVFVHRSSKLVREINLEQDIKNFANTFKTSFDNVCDYNTSLVIFEFQREPNRQSNELLQSGLNWMLG